LSTHLVVQCREHFRSTIIYVILDYVSMLSKFHLQQPVKAKYDQNKPVPIGKSVNGIPAGAGTRPESGLSCRITKKPVK
ncbi:unnamed protein product, partial [Didymodactylos carnosus]